MMRQKSKVWKRAGARGRAPAASIAQGAPTRSNPLRKRAYTLNPNPLPLTPKPSTLNPQPSIGQGAPTCPTLPHVWGRCMPAQALQELSRA